MSDPTQMHWAAQWGDKTACGKDLWDVQKLLIMSRSALTVEALDHIKCDRCRASAERTMYSVAPL